VGNAIWLLIAAPTWFFETIGAPFGAGVLSAVPAFGVVCLFVGLALCTRYRKLKLLSFLLPFAGSVGLTVTAGFFRGQLPEPEPVLYSFLALQFVLIVFLVYKLRDAWPPAVFLAIFSAIYALWSYFVSVMAFTNIWL
jgi:hypothetical protein